jgi:hypothetical protein
VPQVAPPLISAGPRAQVSKDMKETMGLLSLVTGYQARTAPLYLVTIDNR